MDVGATPTADVTPSVDVTPSPGIQGPQEVETAGGGGRGVISGPCNSTLDGPTSSLLRGLSLASAVRLPGFGGEKWDLARGFTGEGWSVRCV